MLYLHWQNKRVVIMDTENKTKTSIQVRLSCLVMGLGQIANKQIIKGVLYLLCLGLFLAYMFSFGINDLKGFFTLGTTEADPGSELRVTIPL